MSTPQIERIDVGETAPDFTGTIQDGSEITLSDHRGSWVALYFYPKDDTPGCTKQACNLRDGMERLKEHGITVIGVSEDDVASHEAFAGKYELPFPIVADPDHQVLDAYGVYGERSMYGNTFLGTARTTYLIDSEGVIRHVFKRPKTGNHTTEILEKYDGLA
jgi:thioredoxin-dependent peroxiredoxin